MKIQVNADKTLMTVGDRAIKCSCIVRNEVNGWRKSNEVVLSEPSPGSPYMPRVFPSGSWNVGMPSREASTPSYIMYWWIPTDAWQLLPVWTTKEQESHEEYVEATGQNIRDSGYGLHCSSSPTTLGCIRIGEAIGAGEEQASVDSKMAAARADIEWLATQIITAHQRGEPVVLEVA